MFVLQFSSPLEKPLSKRFRANHIKNRFSRTISCKHWKKPQTPHEWSFRRRKTCGEKFFQIEIPRLIAFVSVEGREIRCIVLNDNEPSSTDGEETRFHFDRIGSPLLSPIFRQMILHAIRSFPCFRKSRGRLFADSFDSISRISKLANFFEAKIYWRMILLFESYESRD